MALGGLPLVSQDLVALSHLRHVSLNDGVVEGLELTERGAFSVQYHPEAAAGPHDAAHLFDRFIEVMVRYPRNGGAL